MAAERQREQLSVLLDWVTVRYRTIWLFLAVLVGILILSGFVFWRVQGKDRRDAQSEIYRAEELRREASVYARGGRLAEYLREADAKLEQARSSFVQSQYGESKTSAIVSQNTSQKIIDMGRGEATTRGEVRFYRIEGEVRVKRAGQFHWESADSKMLLRIGDQVKTSRNSGASIIYFDGSITTIKPGSLLEIKDLYEEPATKKKRVAEKLSWGEIEASTRRPDVEGSVHEVSTETAVARSRDEATFQVRSEEGSGDAAVTLLTGNINVIAGGENVALSERERVRVLDGAVAGVEQLPMIPRLIQPPDQKVFNHSQPAKARTTLVWERTAQAARYRLQISNRALFTETLVEKDVKSSSVELTGLQPAGYYWRVAAIDQSGTVGPFSASRKFRIALTQLHERADNVPPKLKIQDFVQNGAIIIINGTTEPGANVWVDNERVDVDDRGEFRTVVRLRQDGLNTIRLAAQDAAGNESVRSLEAVVETY
jgi:hypothetical protein